MDVQSATDDGLREDLTTGDDTLSALAADPDDQILNDHQTPPLGEQNA
jgi:hypothetical protein